MLSFNSNRVAVLRHISEIELIMTWHRFSNSATLLFNNHEKSISVVYMWGKELYKIGEDIDETIDSYPRSFCLFSTIKDGWTHSKNKIDGFINQALYRDKTNRYTELIKKTRRQITGPRFSLQPSLVLHETAVYSWLNTALTLILSILENEMILRRV